MHVSMVLFRVCCSRPSVGSSTNGSAASSPVSGRLSELTATLSNLVRTYFRRWYKLNEETQEVNVTAGQQGHFHHIVQRRDAA